MTTKEDDPRVEGIAFFVNSHVRIRGDDVRIFKDALLGECLLTTYPAVDIVVLEQDFRGYWFQALSTWIPEQCVTVHPLIGEGVS